MKKLFLTLFALMMATASLWAEDFSVNGIYYNITDETNKTVEVTYRGSKYNSYSNEYSGKATIPSSVTYSGTTYSVTSIGEFAFYGCGSLTSVTIPESVIKIDKFAFSSCNGLPLITIPNSVTLIGQFAFSNCTGLTSVTIPNRVTSIDSYAFYNCTGLTSVTIGNSVTEIGDYAFSNCTGLIQIHLLATTPSTMSNKTFNSYDIPISVPKESIEVYRQADGWKDFTHIGYPCNLILSTDDTSMGSVDGSGLYVSDLMVIATAIPAQHYYFVQWSDKNKENPRSITMMEDVTLTAQFERYRYLNLQVNDETMGSVTITGGNNAFKKNETALIAAIPEDGYEFLQWSDGVTDNPRMIIMTEDISLTAEFKTPSGVTTLSDSYIKVYANDGVLHIDNAEAGEQVTICDLSGRIIKTGETEAGNTCIALDNGVYVVRVQGKIFKIIL